MTVSHDSPQLRSDPPALAGGLASIAFNRPAALVLAPCLASTSYLNFVILIPNG